MRKFLTPLTALITATCASPPETETPLPETPAPITETQAEDPNLWLEAVEGEDALAWVRAQNARSLAELQADPRYEGFEAAALDALNSKERIPYGAVRDGMV